MPHASSPAPLRLASRSPRRARLLREAGIPFRPGPFPDVDETPPPGVTPPRAARLLAERKARAALSLAGGETVLAADTIVFVESSLFGKPTDAEDARRMLTRLSGCTHAVATGVAVGREERLLAGVEVTSVRFRRLSRWEIEDYVRGGEPLDKAGAYAIQGGAAGFVEAIEGNLDTVIGLPVALVLSLWSRVAEPGD